MHDISSREMVKIYITSPEILLKRERPPSVNSVVLVAAGRGFEPRQTESESVVLPLHNPAISFLSAVADDNYYTVIFYGSQAFFSICFLISHTLAFIRCFDCMDPVPLFSFLFL